MKVDKRNVGDMKTFLKLFLNKAAGAGVARLIFEIIQNLLSRYRARKRDSNTAPSPSSSTSSSSPSTSTSSSDIVQPRGSARSKKKGADTPQEALLNALRFALFIPTFSFSTKYLSRLLFKSGLFSAPLAEALGGSIASLSVLIERQDWVRVYASQYLIVRGLESVYNEHKAKDGWLWRWFGSAKYSHLYLFMFICGQAMYSYVMRPDSIPNSYYRFIRSSGPVHEVALQATRDNERGIDLDHEKLNEWLKKRNRAFRDTANVTPQMKRDQEKLAKEMMKDPRPSFLSCAYYHPQTASCVQGCCDAFVSCFRKCFTMYLVISTIPLVLRAGPAYIMKNKAKVLKTILTGATRHTMFLSTFVLIFQSGACMCNKLQNLGIIPIHRLRFWLIGALSGLSSFFETQSGIVAFNVYGIPKIGESLYTIMCDRYPGYFRKVPFGEMPMFMVGAALLIYFYRTNPKVLGPNSLVLIKWLLQ